MSAEVSMPAVVSAPVRHDLAVVMPVYNEEACIDDVIRDWIAVLGGLAIDYTIIILNDGSRDGTTARLSQWEQSPHVRGINKPNEGHGPTILRGYRAAVAEANWVFQVDSDNELPASLFPDFWRRRTDHDFLFGIRADRTQSTGHRLISTASRAMVTLLAGRAVKDVNVPYRLMRASCLQAMLPLIPPRTFAPNVALAGLAVRGRCRILNLPVPHRPRTTGAVSLDHGRMWMAALQSFVQTGRILLAHRGFQCGT